MQYLVLHKEWLTTAQWMQLKNLCWALTCDSVIQSSGGGEKRAQQYFIHAKFIFPFYKAGQCITTFSRFLLCYCLLWGVCRLSLSFQIIDLPNKHCTLPQALTIKFSFCFSVTIMSYSALCTYLAVPALSGNPFVTRIQGRLYSTVTVSRLYIMSSTV